MHINIPRLQLTLMRCERSVQCLGCVARRQLPVVNLSGHTLEKLAKHKLFIQIPRQSNHHVVSNLLYLSCLMGKP